MKYRDIILLFLAIGFILSIGYVLGVNSSHWLFPVILFALLVIVVYKLWIEK